MIQTPILPKQEVAPLLASGVFGRPWYLYFQSQSSFNILLTGLVSRGTHAERLALDPAAVGDGAIFVESDRNGITYQFDGTNWVYLSGAYSVDQSDISGIGFTSGDKNAVIYVADYAHYLKWTGSAFTWADGERGSGETTLFEVDPTGVGWQLYDGSVAQYLKADGTTGSKTLPNLAGSAAYLKAGSPNTGINAATAPGFTGTPVTPTGTVGAINATLTTGVAVVVAAGTIVSVETHSHPAPSLSINPITPAGTVDNTGEPQNIVRRPWFRL